MIVVQVDGVERTYPGHPGSGLGPTSFSIEGGERAALTGPSGAGKSTLLNLLGLIDCPTAGRYLLGGKDTAAWSSRQRTKQRARGIGFVFQSYHLLGHLTCIENIELGLSHAGWPRSERRARAVAFLDRVGMSDHAHHLASTLSGGEQQRVAVARATAHDPILVLADEPTGNLDRGNASLVLDALSECVADDRAIVVVTHSEEVSLWADRSVEIRAPRARSTNARPR